MSESVAVLTTIETTELAQCEQVIERGLQTFYEVGAALLAIRDKRLYRAEHGTFEDYCLARWGFSDRRARQLMSAAETFVNIQTGTIVPVLPATESQARPLSTIEPEHQAEVWQRVIDTAPEGKITASHVTKIVEEYKKPEAHQLIHQSISNEWYTPKAYLDAVREVMGEIDLDPATCELANQIVRAKYTYTIDDDGIKQDWYGHVFLNPPYGHEEGEGSNQARWSAKLISEYKLGRVEEAILLVSAVTGNQWFAPLWDYLICFTDHRIRFYNVDGEFSQPTQSNAFIYMGPNPQKFTRIFSQFGVVAKRVEVGE